MDTPYFLFGTANADALSHLHLAMQQQAARSTVTTVASGYQLLQFLQGVAANKTYPFLIVLDANMVHPPVREMLELLKTDDIYRLIPVLLLYHTDAAEKDPFFTHFRTAVLKQPDSVAQWAPVLTVVDTFADA